METYFYFELVTRVVIQKYIAPLSIFEWIRLENKMVGGASIIWKAMIKAFDLVGSGLAWNVGDGRRVRLSMDPWVESGRAHILPVLFWPVRGYHFLSQVVDTNSTSIWQQGWLAVPGLELDMEHWDSWNGYTFGLRQAHVRLSNAEDVLI